jgi:uncharacterized protein (DUF39 family)
MSSRYLRAAHFQGYGATLFVGVGVPIPILDEDLLAHAAVTNDEIFTEVFDYSVQSRTRPSLGRFSYGQLRSGSIKIRGKDVRTAPISSLHRAREIAGVLKGWLATGQFQVAEPVSALPGSGSLRPLKVDGCQGEARRS